MKPADNPPPPILAKAKSPSPSKRSVSSKKSSPSRNPSPVKKSSKNISPPKEASVRKEELVSPDVQTGAFPLLVPSERSDDQSKIKRKKKKKRRRQLMQENPREEEQLKPYRKPREVAPEPAKHQSNSSEEGGFDFNKYYNNIIKDDSVDKKPKNRFDDKVRREGQKHEMSKVVN